MAPNDPQWGRRGGDGPPDLDELFNRLREKFGGLFGGKGPRPPSGGPADFKRFGGGVGLLAALLVIIWLGSGFYIVNPSQRGVVLRFGKYVETKQEGPRWHLPYPIESVELVNLSQVRTVEVGYRNSDKNKSLKESLMLTDDENIIDMEFAVQYTLKDPIAFLFNNRDADQETVRQIAESAIREVVGKSKMDFALYEGREQIALNIKTLMQSILDRYGTGVSISQVTMQQAQPPEQVQAAFDDAVKANQDRERQKNEGQAYANDVVPKARGSASRLLQEAEGHKQRVIANAEGEASRFRAVAAEYKRAPGVTRDRLYIDAMQQVMSSTTKIIVDQKAGSLLYLPLDKIMQMSASGNGAVLGDGTPVPEAAASTPPNVELLPRSRDAFRNRDRESRP
ncbi:MAG: FtsH protease activity modulator HflK [Betaproteobacteria bacterium]|nr:FtsH protease activity modulator HflK [Betaproteobacteria bacterium]